MIYHIYDKLKYQGKDILFSIIHVYTFYVKKALVSILMIAYEKITIQIPMTAFFIFQEFGAHQTLSKIY